MKVISGILKGRTIKGHDIEGTRPTMDRVKESLFAMIQNYIKDKVVLDLFAGSGNLGIEALSNGAKFCYFNDINKKCIKVIKENITTFGIDNKAEIINADYQKALIAFKEENIKFDLVFLDPPYKQDITSNIVMEMHKYDLFNEGAKVVIEKDNDEEPVIENFALIKSKKYGDKYIFIISRK